MLGGNHSREVFQKLIKEPKMRLLAAVQERPAVVYANLNDEKALLIGRSHNIAGEIRLATKFRDDVELVKRI